jgi:hypothetical protein
MTIKTLPYPFIFVPLALALTASFLYAIDQQPVVIGYIDDSRFHPLVIATADTISKADSAKLELKGQLRNAFEDTPQTFSVKKQQDYTDPYDDKDTPRRFALTDKKFSSVNTFFTLQPTAFPSQSPDAYKEIARKFYAFFSGHKWGRHFFTDKKLLEKPLEEIAEKTNLRIHVVTDLNHNSSPELWVTYKLMHGEIGRMVYEQVGDGSNWEEIANHCYECD